MIEIETGQIGPIGPIPENIPERLTERPQWVCWRVEEREGKPTKVPYIPGKNRMASSTNPSTWRTFDEALEVSEGDFYDGIGFVFSEDDLFVGIDLDECRDPDDGTIATWAKVILSHVASCYTEVSPSGTGIHIIVEGTTRGTKTRKDVYLEGIRVGRIEMYGSGRFFTITGERP
jgi:primase-polymerase (primpol)-like protein